MNSPHLPPALAVNTAAFHHISYRPLLTLRGFSTACLCYF